MILLFIIFAFFFISLIYKLFCKFIYWYYSKERPIKPGKGKRGMSRLLKNLPCGIYTFFGVPGSGKTTFAAFIVFQCIKFGIPVFSNVPIHGAYVVDRKDIGKYQLPLLGSSRCVLIVDEAGAFYNNREYKSNFSGDDALYWWTHHRHQDCWVFILSQTYSDFDKKLRNLCQKYFVIKKSHLPFVRKAVPIKFDVGVNEVSKEICDEYSFPEGALKWFESIRIWTPKYWSMFDSWDGFENFPVLPYLNKYVAGGIVSDQGD